MIDTASFKRHGFQLVKEAFGDTPTGELLEAVAHRMETNAGLVARNGEPYAMRGIVAQCPDVAACIRGSILPQLVRSILGDDAKIVRSLLFDKTPENNWGVPWHRDMTIAVKQNAEVPGFAGWRRKGEGWYVEPPFALLQRMVTVRVHLDNCLDNDGPLSVVPGSHEWPELSWEQLLDRTKESAPIEVHARRRDALLMRPLIAHSSRRALNPSHRRILHLEFCADKLPAGLDWCD